MVCAQSWYPFSTAAASAATEINRSFEAAHAQFPPVYDLRDPNYRAWPMSAGLERIVWPRDLEISEQAFETWRRYVRNSGLL